MDIVGQPLRLPNRNAAGDAPALQPPSHHSWLPGEDEESDEHDESGIDQQLDNKGNKQEPIKKRRSPNPVANHTQHHEWFDDRKKEIDRIRIVQVVMMGKPPAANQEAINPRRADKVNDGIDNRLWFQRSDIIGERSVASRSISRRRPVAASQHVTCHMSHVTRHCFLIFVVTGPGLATLTLAAFLPFFGPVV